MMFGEIGAWFFKGLGGIRPDPQAPGFRHILLSPSFVDGLDYFEASHMAPDGLIVSSWRRKGRTVTYTVKVPSNTTATLTVQARRLRSVEIRTEETADGVWKAEIPAGSWQFTVTL